MADGIGELAMGGESYGGSESKSIRLPRKNINQEYLTGILLEKRDLDAIIKNINTTDDPRIYLMARQIINSILDDEIRYKLIDALDEEINKINGGKESTTEKGVKIIKASQDAVGEVNSYLDEFFALHKGQVIGDV